MKIKAFGMDIQVTEKAVFVNGREVYNKMEQEQSLEDLCTIANLDEESIKKWCKVPTDKFIEDMHNYSSVSSLIEPKDESDNEQRMNVIGQNGND